MSIASKRYRGALLGIVLVVASLVAIILPGFIPEIAVVEAAQEFDIKIISWDIIGLDSNQPASGPNRFPVGARVCNTGDTPSASVTVTLNWDSANSYIDLYPNPAANQITLNPIGVGSCSDAYFEVDVDRDSNAYETWRQYHITASDGVASASTPTRALYIEYLISQNRNSTNTVRYRPDDGVSSFTNVAAGNTMTLYVGETYEIELTGGTATQGYEQFEEFLTLCGQ
jgi:hypothetical protein